MKEQVKFDTLTSFQVFRYFLKYAEKEEKFKLEIILQKIPVCRILPRYSSKKPLFFSKKSSKSFKDSSETSSADFVIDLKDWKFPSYTVVRTNKGH